MARGAWLIGIQMRLFKYTLFFTKIQHSAFRIHAKAQKQVSKEQQSFTESLPIFVLLINIVLLQEIVYTKHMTSKIIVSLL